MDILTERQHRALAFIDAATQGGHAPTERAVELWLNDPNPRVEGGSLARGLANSEGFRSFLSTMSQLAGTSEGTLPHLKRLGWVESTAVSGGGGCRLTPLGRALLRSADATDDEALQVVVLQHDNPLSYPMLIGELSGMGEAMLVDPYFDLQGCADVLARTQVSRVLMSDGSSTAPRRAAIATYLSGMPDRGIEVRASDGLHDRLVIAGDGRVSTIGSSLNGIARGRASSIVTPLPKAAADAMASEMEAKWAAATPLLVQVDSREPADARDESLDPDPDPDSGDAV
ncbi:hypothetical protein [Nostocoides vanveenii]|uniref:Uncharacterized protein n=1 Tax=Nostocoides vanveenii TaxID=330835 RepID=A0ABP4WBB1_9MICO